MLYGVNFNLASIKLPTLGTFGAYISNEEYITFALDKCSFDDITMSIQLRINNDYTSLIATKDHSYTFKLADLFTEEDYDKTCEFNISIIGASSKYSKTITILLNLNNIKHYTLPSSTLVCSQTTLCKED